MVKRPSLVVAGMRKGDQAHIDRLNNIFMWGLYWFMGSTPILVIKLLLENNMKLYKISPIVDVIVTP